MAPEKYIHCAITLWPSDPLIAMPITMAVSILCAGVCGSHVANSAQNEELSGRRIYSV